MQAGSYAGTVTISANGYQTETVPVTLMITPAPVLNALPEALSFAYQQGGSAPLAQTVSVTSQPPGVPFTLSASAAWIHTVGGGSTNSIFSVSVDPAGMAEGTYHGSVSVISSQAGNSPVLVQVDLTITSAPLLTASPSALQFSYTQLATVPPPQPVSIGSSKPLAFTTRVSLNTPWLSVSGGATTPSIITVTVDPTGLAQGDYESQVLVDSPGAANTPLIIPVTVAVTAAPLLRVNPTQLTFGSQVKGQAASAQALTVISTGAPVNVTAITSGESWLSISGGSTATPAVFTVKADGSKLAEGTYQGSVMVTSGGASNSPVTVPVTLIVSAAPALTATPSQVSFSYQPGQSLPANHQVLIPSTGTPLKFTVGTSSTTWLTAQGDGTTPSTVELIAKPTGLGPGTYQETVVITSSDAGNSPLSIPVTLVVADAVTLTASPSSLSLTYEPSQSLPPPQQVRITSSGAQIAYSASIAPGSPWLSVSGDSLTPGTLTITVSPSGLAPGDYTGIVVIQSSAANNPLEVPVSLRVIQTASLLVSPQILRFT